LWELRQVHQGIARRWEQLGECQREIVGIQGTLQQLFEGMNKLNSEAKKQGKNSKEGSMGSENRPPDGRTARRGRQSTGRNQGKS